MNLLSQATRNTGFPLDPIDPLTGAVHEPSYDGYESFRERHLHCIWYDETWRPGGLQTATGEPLRVIHPGTWNLEAGPDFLDAEWILGTECRRMRGDVEIHIHPSGWRQHGHHKDPRYRGVRLHLTYFPGTLPSGQLPRGTVEVSLQHALKNCPGFSFASIDLAAYPYAVPGKPPPCAELIQRHDPSFCESLLESAGKERILRKAESLAYRGRRHGFEQVTWETFLEALGYKHNKHTARELGQRIPLAELKEAVKSEAHSAYAILLGAAGLLQPGDARPLWDTWWKTQAQWHSRCLPAKAWQLDHCRPANHPARRLLAAAHIAGDSLPFIERIVREAGEGAPGKRGRNWQTWLGTLGTLPEEPRIIGPGRAAALVHNLLDPVWIALRPREDTAWLAHLPAEQDNRLLRETAALLLGRDYPPRRISKGLHRQGLMQIFHDYCLHHRTCCTNCPLPSLMESGAQASSSGRGTSSRPSSDVP